MSWKKCLTPSNVLFCLTNSPNLKIYSVYCRLRRRKSANRHIWEAEIAESSQYVHQLRYSLSLSAVIHLSSELYTTAGWRTAIWDRFKADFTPSSSTFPSSSSPPPPPPPPPPRCLFSNLTTTWKTQNATNTRSATGGLISVLSFFLSPPAAPQKTHKWGVKQASERVRDLPPLPHCPPYIASIPPASH